MRSPLTEDPKKEFISLIKRLLKGPPQSVNAQRQFRWSRGIIEPDAAYRTRIISECITLFEKIVSRRFGSNRLIDYLSATTHPLDEPILNAVNPLYSLLIKELTNEEFSQLCQIQSSGLTTLLFAIFHTKVNSTLSILINKPFMPPKSGEKRIAQISINDPSEQNEEEEVEVEVETTTTQEISPENVVEYNEKEALFKFEIFQLLMKRYMGGTSKWHFSSTLKNNYLLLAALKGERCFFNNIDNGYPMHAKMFEIFKYHAILTKNIRAFTAKDSLTQTYSPLAKEYGLFGNTNAETHYNKISEKLGLIELDKFIHRWYSSMYHSEFESKLTPFLFALLTERIDVLLKIVNAPDSEHSIKEYIDQTWEKISNPLVILMRYQQASQKAFLSTIKQLLEIDETLLLGKPDTQSEHQSDITQILLSIKQEIINENNKSDVLTNPSDYPLVVALKGNQWDVATIIYQYLYHSTHPPKVNLSASEKEALEFIRNTIIQRVLSAANSEMLGHLDPNKSKFIRFLLEDEMMDLKKQNNFESYEDRDHLFTYMDLILKYQKFISMLRDERAKLERLKESVELRRPEETIEVKDKISAKHLTTLLSLKITAIDELIKGANCLLPIKTNVKNWNDRKEAYDQNRTYLFDQTEYSGYGIIALPFDVKIINKNAWLSILNRETIYNQTTLQKQLDNACPEELKQVQITHTEVKENAKAVKENKQMKSHLIELPDEIILKILTYLPLISLLRFARTSTYYYDLAQDNFLWRCLFKRDFPEDLRYISKNVSYQKHYIDYHQSDLNGLREKLMNFLKNYLGNTEATTTRYRLMNSKPPLRDLISNYVKEFEAAPNELLRIKPEYKKRVRKAIICSYIDGLRHVLASFPEDPLKIAFDEFLKTLIITNPRFKQDLEYQACKTFSTNLKCRLSVLSNPKLDNYENRFAASLGKSGGILFWFSFRCGPSVSIYVKETKETPDSIATKENNSLTPG